MLRQPGGSVAHLSGGNQGGAEDKQRRQEQGAEEQGAEEKEAEEQEAEEQGAEEQEAEEQGAGRARQSCSAQEEQRPQSHLLQSVLPVPLPAEERAGVPAAHSGTSGGASDARPAGDSAAGGRRDVSRWVFDLVEQCRVAGRVVLAELLEAVVRCAVEEEYERANEVRGGAQSLGPRLISMGWNAGTVAVRQSWMVNACSVALGALCLE